MYDNNCTPRSSAEILWVSEVVCSNNFKNWKFKKLKFNTELLIQKIFQADFSFYQPRSDAFVALMLADENYVTDNLYCRQASGSGDHFPANVTQIADLGDCRLKTLALWCEMPPGTVNSLASPNDFIVGTLDETRGPFSLLIYANRLVSNKFKPLAKVSQNRRIKVII